MNKKTLKQLGTLHEMIIQAHNDWVSLHYEEQALLKLQLLKKVAKQLEEQKRGKLKSSLNYSLMAAYLIANASISPYSDLHKGIMDIVLAKNIIHA